MSMLTMQADKLRSWADQLSEREDEFGVVVHALVADLREAADTIESLRDRLQESERHNRINLEAMGEMHHPEIVELMQECHATQANYEHCKYSTNRGWCDTSRYAELFGTPERAARTLLGGCDNCEKDYCGGCGMLVVTGHEVDYDALLERLRGDAE